MVEMNKPGNILVMKQDIRNDSKVRMKSEIRDNDSDFQSLPSGNSE